MAIPTVPELAQQFSIKYPVKPYVVDPVSIDFEYEGENALRVFITTPDTELRAVTASDVDEYLTACGDAHNMRLYARGKAWERDYTAGRIEKWENLWNANIPFSGFAVHKREDGAFIGHVALDYDEETPEGAAEISYFTRADLQGKGLSSQAIWSVVNPFSDEIVRHNYLCQEKPYTQVYCTARHDNPPSVVVMWKSGMDIKQKDGVQVETQWGPRLTFFKSVADKPSEKTTVDLLPNVMALARMTTP